MKNKMKKGFTLVEVIIALCIMGLLASIIFTAIGISNEEKAKKARVSLEAEKIYMTKTVPTENPKGTIEITRKFDIIKLFDYKGYSVYESSEKLANGQKTIRTFTIPTIPTEFEKK